MSLLKAGIWGCGKFAKSWVAAVRSGSSR